MKWVSAMCVCPLLWWVQRIIMRFRSRIRFHGLSVPWFGEYWKIFIGCGSEIGFAVWVIRKSTIIQSQVRVETHTIKYSIVYWGLWSYIGHNLVPGLPLKPTPVRLGFFHRVFCSCIILNTGVDIGFFYRRFLSCVSFQFSPWSAL